MSAPPVRIVGGGPAGLAAAIALGRRGARAVVHEAGPGPGLEKPCGEGLMPDGVAVLEAWGLGGLPGRPIRGIEWRDRVRRAGADFPGRPGLGIRRTRLHAALAEAAARYADLRWGERVRVLDPGSPTEPARLEVGGRVEMAELVLAADGLRSPIRAALGLAGAPPRRARFGVRRHLGIAPWSDRVEVVWGEGIEAYLTPVGDRELGVALLWSGRRAGFDALLADFPDLVDRLRGAPRLGRDRGTGPLHQPVRGVGRGRVLLLGDAAGYVDAITGEGLALAFRQAEALAGLVAADRWERWPEVWRRIVRLPLALVRLLLVAEQRPWLRRRLLAAVERDPGLFAGLLGVHVGAAEPGPVLVLRLLRGLVRS